MLTGGLSAGIASYGGSFVKGLDWGYQFAGRTAIGGATGGITTAIYGGNFWKGFARGAEMSGLAFLFNDSYHRSSGQDIAAGGCPLGRLCMESGEIDPNWFGPTEYRDVNMVWPTDRLIENGSNLYNKFLQNYGKLPPGTWGKLWDEAKKLYEFLKMMPK